MRDPRRRWIARGIGLTATLALALVAGVAFSNLCVVRSAAGRARPELAGLPRREVAIVPGTFASHGRPAPMLRARLEAARAALEAGQVSAILVSGNEAAGEVTAMRNWLVQKGVSPAQILSDADGLRTIDTMENAAHRFSVASAIICTQENSMARSLFLARANGIDAVGFEAKANLPWNLRWGGTETLKRTLAFFEVVVLGRAAPAYPSIGHLAHRL